MMRSVYDSTHLLFFFKQKTAYEMRISDWSSDVCSSDLALRVEFGEFADVGAGDEALRLARTQHQPLRRVQREPLEQRLQPDQHVLGEGVYRLSGAVEREHDDAVLALLGLPVAEAPSVEPCNHPTGPLTCLGARYQPAHVRQASQRRLQRTSEP